MQRSTLLLVTLFSCMVSFGQNISVTFTGTGAATTIDSVTATNLRTNQYVTLPGNETLILSFNTGIPDPTELTDHGILFPNPFSGQATLRTMFQNPQKVQLKLQNLVGQVVAQTEAWVQPGENEFSLSVSAAGIYLVTLQSEQGITGFRAVCSQSTGAGNQIGYLGSSQNSNTLTVQTGLRTAQNTLTFGI